MQNSDHIAAVQRMQDYIAAHIKERITMAALAREAGYSPWYAARLFKQLTGRAPFDYVRALRMSKAAMRLHDGGSRVIDVALDFVFDSHEGFTRAFSKQFGITPKRYAKDRPPLHLFMPNAVRDDYLKIQRGELEMEKKLQTVFVQVVERPPRKLILKRGEKASHYFEYCDEVGCDVWETLTAIKDALYEPIGMWLPPGMIRTGTSEYAQGVEVPAGYSGDVPDGFEIIDLPACSMMVFQGPPFDDEKFEDAIGVLWDVMKTYDPTIYGFRWADEDAPRFQLVPMGYRGYIEARPVRAL